MSMERVAFYNFSVLNRVSGLVFMAFGFLLLSPLVAQTEKTLERVAKMMQKTEDLVGLLFLALIALFAILFGCHLATGCRCVIRASKDTFKIQYRLLNIVLRSKILKRDGLQSIHVGKQIHKVASHGRISPSDQPFFCVSLKLLSGEQEIGFFKDRAAALRKAETLSSVLWNAKVESS